MLSGMKPHDLTRSRTSGSLPTRAAMVTLLFEAVGTMYPWPLGLKLNPRGQGDDCEPHAVRGLGSNDKANICEVLINLVIADKPKRLIGLIQNGVWPVYPLSVWDNVRIVPSGKRNRLSHSTAYRAELGNPVQLHTDVETDLQRKVVAVREKDAGKSESLSVMDRIGIETSISMLVYSMPSERKLTSGGSLMVRG